MQCLCTSSFRRSVFWIAMAAYSRTAGYYKVKPVEKNIRQAIKVSQ